MTRFILCRKPLLLAGVTLFLVTGVPTAYAASLQVFVDCGATGVGANGSRQKPFHELAIAVASARARLTNYSDIKISVAAGTCSVSSPVVIDFPVKVQGSSVLNFDAAGRPVGTVQVGTDTLIQGSAALDIKPLIVVQPAPGSTTVSGVSITNLSLAGVNADTLKVQQVQNFTASDLVITAIAPSTPATGIDLSGSSGYVTRSYVKGMSACGVCIAGGTISSPASVNVIQNRIVANGAGGLLLSGTSVTGGDTLTAQVNNNALADNSTGKQGFGVRIIAIGSPALELPNSAHVTASLNGNLLANNRYQLIVDAGFAPRNDAPLPSASCADEAPYVADMNIQLNDNTVTNTAVTVSPALVTTTRVQVWLNNQKLVLWQYLHNSTISIFDPGLVLAGAGTSSPFRYDVPANDRFLNGGTDGGACEGDWSNEYLGNSVSYNGSNLQDKNF